MMTETRPAMLRLFFALPCPSTPGLRRVVAKLETMRPLVTPVAVEQLHMTLRFVGDTPAERVDGLSAALARAVAAAAVGPIELHWTGLGRFPPAGRRPPRTIFATVADPAPLQRLAGALNDELAALEPAIEPERRPFTAHLTLGRVREPRPLRHRRRRGRTASSVPPADALAALERFVADEAHTDLGRSAVQCVQLVASKLTPQDPIHTVRHAVDL